MYPGTIIEYIDKSEIPAPEVAEITNPFYVAVFSSEKGTEEPISVTGQEFYRMFVTPDATQPNGYFIPFAKHGQPLLQAANIIDGDAKLYAKRVVADDATLANLTVFGNVTKGQYQYSINNVPQYYEKTDDGQYVLVNGQKVITPNQFNTNGIANEAVMMDRAEIRYTFTSDESATTIGGIVANNAGNYPAMFKYTATDVVTAGGYTVTDADGVIYEFNLASDLAAGDILYFMNGTLSMTMVNAATGTESTITMTIVETSALTALSFSSTTSYPIMTITDNGRGTSKKKIRIVPNYEFAKDVDFMIYNFQVIEETATLANTIVSLDSNVTYNGQSISIKSQFNSKHSQIKTHFNDAAFDSFVQAIADITGEDATVVKTYDLLNGKNRKGNDIPNIHVFGETADEIAQMDYTSDIDLQSVYGNVLLGGSNGAFGDYPLETQAYADAVERFFRGGDTHDIYDLDNLKFDFIIDANYPPNVKKAIEDFVMFREDTFFLCDFGFEVNDYNDVVEMVNPFNENSRVADSKFVAYYHNFYDIIDPYTKKQITVTITYDLARHTIDHVRNGRIRPFAGQLYGITFPNAIEGTVNYVPKIIPGVNQKQLMSDIRVNYASYYDGVLTMDSEYTSQNKLTQFSYINNVLGVQEVVKAIRTRCPKIRYSFLTQESLNSYKNDVETTVLRKYQSNFATLEMVYLGDATYEANKIFYAGINVRFRDFIQTEIFKVYALY